MQAVVFVSGDQHWAEFSGKEVPETTVGAGDQQMVR